MNIWNFLTRGASTEILPPRYDEGDTFSSLDHQSLSEIAHQLLSGMARVSHMPISQPIGLLSMPAQGLSQLMNAIPGLRTLEYLTNYHRPHRGTEHTETRKPLDRRCGQSSHFKFLWTRK
jgi:hypothetical protein